MDANDTDAPVPDVEILRAEVNAVRSNLADLYAERLGSECTTQ